MNALELLRNDRRHVPDLSEAWRIFLARVKSTEDAGSHARLFEHSQGLNVSFSHRGDDSVSGD
ncbi:MAG: hypothetical protein ACT4QB_09765 [Gammaproteobacteria bacterium]